jgi:hypothetical protein
MTNPNRPRRVFTPEQLERAREMMSDGCSWARIGARLGCDDETIRARIDPDYKAMRSSRYTGPLSGLRAGSDRHLNAALARVPADSRSRQAKFMGDPLPGRSALDQISSGQVKRWQAPRILSPTINSIDR